MPRNSQGQYFLPDGNPVTPGELIKSEWANSTMDDIAGALTNSLDRAGAGGMTGQFKAASGTLARPGISFSEDNTSGLQKESDGVIAAVSKGVKQAYWSPNGFFVTTVPNDKMEVANKGYVDQFASQATKVVGTFGQTKTPDQLPLNGYIPANWDAPGVPQYAIQMQGGQSLAYRPTKTSDPQYDNVFVYTGTNFIATGWVNIGSVEGPPGPQGNTGPAGPQGPEGPEGPQGPTGQTGNTGPQGPQGAPGQQGPQGEQGQEGPTGPTGPSGPQGPEGPVGPQGQQGSPGASAVIIGDFGASKTPAQLPPSGLIPANWDSPGVPPNDYQMQVGQALVYTACPPGTTNYGHLYSFVGNVATDFDPNNWADCGDIVGPQGPKGATGAQGPAGPTGTQGPQGIKGDTGSQGPKGDTGATGPQGPAGTNGAQGPEGKQGPAGPTGPQGPAGAQGDVGPNLVSTTTATAINGVLAGNGTKVVQATAAQIVAGIGATAVQNATNVTGTVGSAVTGTTQAVATNNTTIATTAFVKAAIASIGIVGEIRMFKSGVTLPAGWYICNGSNGTVDLRDRFIVASGTKFSAGSNGGSFTISTAQMPSHTHTGTTGTESAGHTHTYSGTTGAMSANASHSHTVSDPGHSHAASCGQAYNGGTSPLNSNIAYRDANVLQTLYVNNAKTGIGLTATSTDHTHTFSGTSAGVSATHTHSFTTAAAGSGSEFIPTYYALVFAQYIGV